MNTQTDKGYLYLKPDERKFFVMAALTMLDTLEEQLDTYKWKPEARRALMDMYQSGISLKRKLVNLEYDMSPLLSSDRESYLEPDEEMEMDMETDMEANEATGMGMKMDTKDDERGTHQGEE